MDEAWPGDIIGIPNHGTLRVGDTLSESGAVTFTGIPNFAPEILRRVRLGDPMKQKHLARALTSLAEEGVTLADVVRVTTEDEYFPPPRKLRELQSAIETAATVMLGGSMSGRRRVDDRRLVASDILAALAR